MGFGGSAGGGGSLSGSSDVAMSNVLNDQVLKYDSAAAKWKNGTSSSGATLGTIEYNGSSWPTRPAASTAQIFMSTKYPTAAEPSDMVIGDIWIRHPDALEQL